MEHVSAAGDRSRQEFDGFGRLVRQRAPDGAGVDVAYEVSSVGWMDVVVQGTDDSFSYTTLDVLGREISSGRSVMNSGIPRIADTARTYDHFGRLTRIDNPVFDGGTTTGYVEMVYDNIDRPVQMFAQDRSYMQWTYTGRRTTQRDFRGNHQRTELDPEMRFQRSMEGAGGLRTEYEYGFFGEVERVTAGGQVWEYDTAGSYQLPTATEDPDAGRREYLFNSLGELRAERDPLGNVLTVTRDSVGRVQRLDTPTEGATTWEWDGLDGPGRLDRTCSHVGTSSNVCVDYEYTDAGQIKRELRTIAGVATLRTDFSYNPVGQLASVRYPTLAGARPRLRYRYDLGMLSRVEDFETTEPYYQVRNRDEWGHALTERMGRLGPMTGVQTANTFDPVDGRLQSTQSTSGTSTQILQRISYTYDPNGNVETRRTNNGAGSSIVNETFSYDRLNRLTDWTRTGSPPEAYRYDNFGNPTTMRGLPQTFGGAGYGPHQLRRPAGATADVDYDDAGRVSQAGPNLYSWTSFGLPSSVNQSGSVTTYTYGPSHERVRRQGSAGDVVYGGDLYERRIDAGITTHIFHVFAEGREVAQIQRASGTDTVAYLLSDVLGSTTTLASAAGTVLQRHATNPWGVRIGSASGQYRHRFTGHESEDAFGTINMRGRIYDPNSGRFMSADPMTQSPHQAQGLNRYSYVFNNPASGVDRNGLWCDGLSYAVCPDGSESVVDYGLGPPAMAGSSIEAMATPSIATSDIFGISPQEALVAGEYIEAGWGGFNEGMMASVGIAFGLGVIAAFSAPVALAVGLTLLALGALEVYDAYSDGSLQAGYGRLVSGRLTPGDVGTLSSLAGGLFGGVVLGPTAFSTGLRGGLETRVAFAMRRRTSAGRYFQLDNGDVIGIAEVYEGAERGGSLRAVFERMLEIQEHAGVEVGLVSFEDGAMSLVTGGPDGIYYPEAMGIRRVIAHTHDVHRLGHALGPSTEDLLMLREFGSVESGQRSSFVLYLDELGEMVSVRFWQR
jgi:RHS repeat-associated protein